MKAKKQAVQSESWAPRWARYIFFGLLGYMPLHIFLSTWIGSSLNVLDVAKVAKEFVLLFGVGLAIGASVGRPWFKQLFRDTLFWLIGAFALLHLILMGVYSNDQEAELLALAYNLRFLLFFIYAVLLAHLYDRAHMLKRSVQVVFASSFLVLTFGILQYNVLPHNTLEKLGYSRENGVLPAFFIDDKVEYPRVMSTLRDPNSYGSYVLIIIALAAVYLQIVKRYASRWVVIGVLGLALMNLLLTFSRSAWLGLFVVVAVLLYFWIREGRHKEFSKEARTIIVASFIALLVIASGAAFALRDTAAFQNVFFHADDTTVLETPNQKRVRFWRESVDAIAEKPQGYGPGTAGLPSIRNQEQGTMLNENYYLQIGYEVGVIGLALFLSILGIVSARLYRMTKTSIVAVALLASFAGLAFTNLLVHIWANEAVAYTWWGLAGLLVLIREKQPQVGVKKSVQSRQV